MICVTSKKNFHRSISLLTMSGDGDDDDDVGAAAVILEVKTPWKQTTEGESDMLLLDPVEVSLFPVIFQPAPKIVCGALSKAQQVGTQFQNLLKKNYSNLIYVIENLHFPPNLNKSC